MRGRRVATAVATAALVAGASVFLGGNLPSHAETTDDKRAVEEKLDRAEQDLHQSSGELDEAADALRRAQQRLDDARQRLARVQGKVEAARAKERSLRAKWEQAEARLADARERLRRANDRVREQRTQIGAFASANYRTGGGLRDIAVVLGSRSPSDLVDRLQFVRSVSAGQRSALEQMNDARAERAAEKASVARLAERAEQRRQDAVQQLDRMRELRANAREAEAAVDERVDQRADRKRVAEREKQQDLERYRELKDERERIERLLRERAREQQERSETERTGNEESSSSGMIAPVSAPITSSYGMRLHPILGYEKLHDGTDFGAACGTPVRAAASGAVVSHYFNTGYGNRVIVDHGDGIATAYNHLSGYAVSDGEQVSQGEVIGYVGTTGYSTGCHLHFMVLENGTPVDPAGYLP